MAATEIVGLGAGGHARSLIELFQLDRRFTVVGLLDPDPTLAGTRVHGVPVLGDDSRLAQLADSGLCHFFLGLGGVGNNTPRRHLYQFACSLGMEPVTIVHPRAWVAPSARLGAGVIVMAGAVVSTAATIGDNVIVNTGAVVEHDCHIGDHVHIASGATLTSSISVGTSAHIGAGATIRQCLSIGAGAIVGAGAVVVADVAANCVVAGVPARPLARARSAIPAERFPVAVPQTALS